MAVNKAWYVVDTSVLLKFILDEKEDMKQALTLKNLFIEGEIGLVVPSIFYYEASNILMRKMSTPQVLRAISLLKLAGLEVYELDEELIQKTLTLVDDAAAALGDHPKKISFYDASYHALALRHNITYLTADAKYHSQMKHMGNIQLLKDWRQK